MANTNALLDEPKQNRPEPVKACDANVPSAIFPNKIVVDGISVDGFASRDFLFERLVYECKKPGKALFFALNVHNANMCTRSPRLKKLFNKANVVYCDGAGIKLGAAIQRSGNIPKRYANGDWLFEMFDYLAEQGCSIYYLGNEASVIEQVMRMYTESRPEHSVVGYHHGYILKDPELEKKVIQNINRLKPDILFVGFGCPLQEYWIDEHMEELEVKLFYPIGASLDYIAGKIPRCPVWLGNVGLEWLFRLKAEPTRLFKRYVFGNPSFVFRLLSETYITAPLKKCEMFIANQIVLSSKSILGQ